jgi:Flp pilus assembly protein TadD
LADYAIAIRLDPKDADILSQRGNIRLENGDRRGAFDDFNQAVRLDLKEGSYSRGVALASIGDKKCFEDFNQAQMLDPTSRSHFYQLRGDARSRFGDNRGAIDDFNKSIQLDSKNAWLYSLRGNARMNIKEFVGALVDANEAVRLDPTNSSWYGDRGFARYSQYMLLKLNEVRNILPFH